MDQPKLTLIDQRPSTDGRPTMVGDQDTAGPDNRAFNGTAAVTIPGLLPTPGIRAHTVATAIRR